jgi:hypothetical protein
MTTYLLKEGMVRYARESAEKEPLPAALLLRAGFDGLMRRFAHKRERGERLDIWACECRVES